MEVRKGMAGRYAGKQSLLYVEWIPRFIAVVYVLHHGVQPLALGKGLLIMAGTKGLHAAHELSSDPALCR